MKISWKWAVSAVLVSLLVALVLHGGEGKASAAPVVRSGKAASPRATVPSTMMPRAQVPKPNLPPGYREFAFPVRQAWSVIYSVPAGRTLYITDVCIARLDETPGTPFVCLMHGGETMLGADPFVGLNVAVGQNAIASFQTPAQVAGGDAFSVAVPHFIFNAKWPQQMDVWCFVHGYEE